MATYHVVPDADGDTQRYGWKVTKENVGQKSNHTKKTAALRKAKRMASKGIASSSTDSTGGCKHLSESSQNTHV